MSTPLPLIVMFNELSVVYQIKEQEYYKELLSVMLNSKVQRPGTTASVIHW